MPTYIDEIKTVLAEELSARGSSAGSNAGLLATYATLVTSTGEATTAEQVHDAWAAWTSIDRPDHADLIVYGDLEPSNAARDQRYANAIVATARRIAAKRTEAA